MATFGAGVMTDCIGDVERIVVAGRGFGASAAPEKNTPGRTARKSRSKPGIITTRRRDDGLVTIEEAMTITRRKRATLYDWSHKRRITTFKLCAPGAKPHRGARILFVEAEMHALAMRRRPIR